MRIVQRGLYRDRGITILVNDANTREEWQPSTDNKKPGTVSLLGHRSAGFFPHSGTSHSYTVELSPAEVVKAFFALPTDELARCLRSKKAPRISTAVLADTIREFVRKGRT